MRVITAILLLVLALPPRSDACEHNNARLYHNDSYATRYLHRRNWRTQRGVW
jgi:hypothetical protein